MKKNNKAFGDKGEKLAKDYLKKEKKYKFVESNFRGKHGEIDLIMKDGETLVFIEVKTRAYVENPQFPAYSAVNYNKQRHITSAANEYILNLSEVPACRFDVIEIYMDDNNQKIIHHKNAHLSVY